MTRTRVTLLFTALLASFALSTPSQAATGELVTAQDSPPGQILTFNEHGCTEVAYRRPGLTSAVRPLVPERITLSDIEGLPAGWAPRVRLLINEITCERFVPGQGLSSGQGSGSYTQVIVSVLVTAVDGTPTGGVYVLFHASDSPLQRATLNRLGWPIDELSPETTTELTADPDGTLTGARWNVVGGGWDHETTASRTTAFDAPSPSNAAYFRDTIDQPVTLCYANLLSAASASVTTDLSGTPFASITAISPTFTTTGQTLAVGDWRVTATTGSCPPPQDR